MTLFRLRPVGRTIGHEGGRHRAAMTGRGKGRVARKKLALARARLVGVFSHPSSQIFDSSPAAVPSGTFVSNRRRRRALARALSRGGVSRRLPSTPASDIRGSLKKKRRVASSSNQTPPSARAETSTVKKLSRRLPDQKTRERAHPIGAPPLPPPSRAKRSTPPSALSSRRARVNGPFASSLLVTRLRREFRSSRKTTRALATLAFFF